MGMLGVWGLNGWNTNKWKCSSEYGIEGERVGGGEWLGEVSLRG